MSSTASLPGTNAVWNAQAIDAPDAAAFRAATAARGWVAGEWVAWSTSAAGHWIPAQPIEPIDRIGLTEWNGRLVGWTDGSRITISQDGVTWVPAALGPPEGNPGVVLPVGRSLVLVGQAVHSTAGAWISDDAAHWQPVPDAPSGLTTASLDDEGGLIAAGTPGPWSVVASSPDGLAWTTVPPPDPAGPGPVTLSGIARRGGALAAIGVDGETPVAWARIEDRAWVRTLVVDDPTSLLASISAVPGGFAIAGRRGDRGVIWVSPDGRSWSEGALPASGTDDEEASLVRVVDGRLVVFGHATDDAGNGGSVRTEYRVWTLTRT